MKKYLKLMLVPFLLVFAISSCKKDEHKIYFEGGTAPALSSSVPNTIPLTFANKDKEALNLTWTNPDYKFTTGTSSHSVSYQIEIDTVGANFSNPQKQTISVSSDLSKSFTQQTFNDYLLNQLVLAPGVPHNIEIRVNSFLENNSGKLSSNALQFTVTPYAIPPKVIPPASNELYITGNAVPSDWTNTPPVSQKFTRVSETFYTIIVPLIGNNSYTFLPTYASWSDKYSIATKNDPNEIYGGDFQWQGNDILAPPVSGDYKIDVDFQRGKFTVTKQ